MTPTRYARPRRPWGWANPTPNPSSNPNPNPSPHPNPTPTPTPNSTPNPNPKQVGPYYPLLAAMLTARPWNDILQAAEQPASLVARGTKEDQAQIANPNPDPDH